MLAFLVGLGHQLFDEFILRFPLSVFRFLFRQSCDLGAVVVLGPVVHLVVHPGFLFLKHLFREAHAVDEFRHREFGHLLQGVEEVHHAEVLPRGIVELVHIGQGTVGGRVVVCVGVLQLLAQGSQLLDEDELHQRQQGADLWVREIVVVPFLLLGEVVEEHPFVGLIVVTGEEVVQQLFEMLHAFAFDLSETLALEVDLQDLFLLADHVVVVEDPLVGASHEALRLSFFNKQQVVVSDGLDAFPELSVDAFHGYMRS